VSGAGDTVIAIFTLALSAGRHPCEAAEIANHASGIVVGKLGTATVSPEELLASFPDNTSFHTATPALCFCNNRLASSEAAAYLKPHDLAHAHRSPFCRDAHSCQAPYKKADEEDKKPLKDQSKDTTYQAFLGRLRIAVAKRDIPMLASMMTADFGYRWDTPPPGETPFDYWDQNNLWGELNSLLKERFAPKDLYMVAPPQAVSDPSTRGIEPACGSSAAVGNLPTSWVPTIRSERRSGQSRPASPRTFHFRRGGVGAHPRRSGDVSEEVRRDRGVLPRSLPGDPLVPGVILTEALAQTAGLAAGEEGRSFASQRSRA
jgi:hypothetical protein